MKGCEYCRSEKNLGYMFMVGDREAALAGVYKDSLIIRQIASHVKHPTKEFIKIYYCPMCGKQL